MIAIRHKEYLAGHPAVKFGEYFREQRMEEPMMPFAPAPIGCDPLFLSQKISEQMSFVGEMSEVGRTKCDFWRRLCWNCEVIYLVMNPLIKEGVYCRARYVLSGKVRNDEVKWRDFLQNLDHLVIVYVSDELINLLSTLPDEYKMVHRMLEEALANVYERYGELWQIEGLKVMRALPALVKEENKLPSSSSSSYEEEEESSD
jgi:hypothetical protein